MPTISFTTDNTTATTIATALAAYYNAGNGFTDGSGNALTGQALIKAVVIKKIREDVKRYNIDQGTQSNLQNAQTIANGLNIT